MKKLVIWAVAAVFSLGTTFANTGIQDPNVKHEKQHKITHNKVTQNKMTRGIGEGGEAVGKGGKEVGKSVGNATEHGAYYVSHNKVTKKTEMNKGNQRYSDTKEKSNM